MVLCPVYLSVSPHFKPDVKTFAARKIEKQIILSELLTYSLRLLQMMKATFVRHFYRRKGK